MLMYTCFFLVLFLLAGKVAPQVLSFFDFNGEELLYHFRFLPAERRAAAAHFVASNTLDAPVRAAAGLHIRFRVCVWGRGH
jgi:hypothetical protein